MAQHALCSEVEKNVDAYRAGIKARAVSYLLAKKHMAGLAFAEVSTR
jgi:hypothetical protein